MCHTEHSDKDGRVLKSRVGGIDIQYTHMKDKQVIQFSHFNVLRGILIHLRWPHFSTCRAYKCGSNNVQNREQHLSELIFLFIYWNDELLWEVTLLLSLPSLCLTHKPAVTLEITTFLFFVFAYFGVSWFLNEYKMFFDITYFFGINEKL